MSQNDTKNNSSSGCITLIVFAILLAFVFWGYKSFTGTGGIESRAKTYAELAYNEMTTSMKISLMTYAQTVLDDYIADARYSSDIDNYTFIRSDYRYKIEGKVNGEKFYMILDWDYVEDEYFDLISLKVGAKTLKSGS